MKTIFNEECDVDELLSIANDMKIKNAKLTCINGYINGEGNNVVVYIFRLEQVTYWFKIIGVDEIPSISNVFLGAKLFEEELQELMPISIIGARKGQRVFLPEEFEIGVGQILIMQLDELRKLKNN